MGGVFESDDEPEDGGVSGGDGERSSTGSGIGSGVIFFRTGALNGLGIAGVATVVAIGVADVWVAPSDDTGTIPAAVAFFVCERAALRPSVSLWRCEVVPRRELTGYHRDEDKRWSWGRKQCTTYVFIASLLRRIPGRVDVTCQDLGNMRKSVRHGPRTAGTDESR